MNSSRAFELAWRIDHEGQATVYSGHESWKRSGRSWQPGITGRGAVENNRRAYWSAPTGSTQTQVTWYAFFGAVVFVVVDLRAAEPRFSGFLCAVGRLGTFRRLGWSLSRLCSWAPPLVVRLIEFAQHIAIQHANLIQLNSLLMALGSPLPCQTQQTSPLVHFFFFFRMRRCSPLHSAPFKAC